MIDTFCIRPTVSEWSLESQWAITVPCSNRLSLFEFRVLYMSPCSWDLIFSPFAFPVNNPLPPLVTINLRVWLG